MIWRKFFRRGLIALLSVIFLFNAAVAGAKVKPYTATAEYFAYQVESQDVAKLRALDTAIKNALEKAGVHLKKYSHSIKRELTDDDTLAITSNNWQLVGEPKFTKTVRKINSTNVIVWKATVKVNVDDDAVQNWLNYDYKEVTVNQAIDVKRAEEKNDRLIKDLHEKYNRATSQAERDSIINQMKDADNVFLAIQKVEEGIKLNYAKGDDNAIKFYDEAIEFKPDWAWLYNNRGFVYYFFHIGQSKRAIQDFDKAIELEPNYAEAYNNRGRAYMSYYSILRRHERAIQDFDKAIELKPNYAEAYYYRGRAYSALNQYERAIQDYSKAIAINPNYANAYSSRGWTYERLDQYDKAHEDFSKVIELKPNDAGSYKQRGNFYDYLGLAFQVIQDFDKATEVYKLAIQDYTKAIELRPNYEVYYFCRACSYAELEQYELAIKDFTKAIELDPNDDYYYYRRGEAYKKLKQYERAIQDFDKAIQIDPSDTLSKDAREDCLKALGK